MMTTFLPFNPRQFTPDTPLSAGASEWLEPASHPPRSSPVPDQMLLLRGFRAVLEALRSNLKPILPILPPELERTIFELAATAYPECASTLVLVAHRTLIWIEPLLYNTVVLGRSRSGEVHDFLRTLHSRPANFFATYVKTLVLTSTVDAHQASHILSICTGVINLISSVPIPLFPPTLRSHHHHHHLHRLSIHLKSHTIPPPDFTHPSLTHLTHLELITPSSTSWSTWPVHRTFATLHNLSHLALAFHGDARLGDLDVIHPILALCPSLKVLVLLAHPDYISLATLDLVHDSFHDPRLAFMREEPRFQDSLLGLRGQRDMWARAEDIVRIQSGTAL